MQHQKFFTKCLPALLLVASSSLSAHDANQPTESTAFSEEDFLSELPVVLTATRLSQPAREAPAATTIIDRKIIKASGARKIADLLRLVPGFMVSHENGYTPVVTYHGLSNERARRMQVLVDGRSVYSPVSGGTRWTDLSLAIDNIERIEVIRGPNAATYGSNAFLSTINIITRHANETTGTFARATGGNNDIRDAYLRYGDTIDDLSYRVTLGYISDRGFPDRYDDHAVKLATFRGDYQWSAADTMEFQLGFNKGKQGVDSKTLNAVDTAATNSKFAMFRWQHEVSTNEKISIKLDYTTERKSQLYDVLIPVLGRVVADNSYNASRIDLEAQHTKQFSKKTRVVWGAGIRQDAASAPGYFGRTETIYNNLYRLFGNMEWHLTQKILLNAGAMWENTNLSGNHLAPRIGINYLFNPVHSLRLTVSRGSRPPTIAEVKSNYRVPVYGSTLPRIPVATPVDFVSTLWKGNKNLDAETITAYELGYMANLPQKGFTLDVKIYQEELKGLIYIDETRVPDPTDYYDGRYEISGNYGDATIKGIETAINYQPLKDTRFILSHSYTNLKSSLPNILPDTGNSTAPKQILSFLAMQGFPGNINGSLIYYHVSKSNGLGSGDPVPGFNRLDLRLALTFKGHRMHGEIAGVLQSVINNNDYLDWRQDNVFEQKQYISLDIQFN